MDPVIELMKKLNIKTDEKGCCFGLAAMALQAWLSNDYQTYLYRSLLKKRTSIRDGGLLRGSERIAPP